MYDVGGVVELSDKGLQFLHFIFVESKTYLMPIPQADNFSLGKYPQ